MDYNKFFEELKKKYTLEEIAEAYIFPSDKTPEEQAAAHAEFGKLRMEMLKNRTEEDKILSDMMRLRFEIKEQLNNGSFSSKKTFGHYLKEYIHITRKSKKEFAEDLSIHYTKLSRLINDREDPNVELTFRLEKHSDNLIPALYWWKLLVKKQEFIISQDTETRKVEYAKVRGLFKKRA